MESKSLINCRWPNKLDSVVVSCLDMDNYIIILLGPTNHVHPYSPVVSGVSGTFSDSHRYNLQRLRGAHVPPPHFLESEVPYLPLFGRMTEKITATFPQHILKIHSNGRSKSRFSNT